MIDKLLAELIVEIKKIRGDQDKIQAYLKTIDNIQERFQLLLFVQIL